VHKAHEIANDVRFTIRRELSWVAAIRGAALLAAGWNAMPTSKTTFPNAGNGRDEGAIIGEFSPFTSKTLADGGSITTNGRTTRLLALQSSVTCGHFDG
jgi:hypothetical protein